MFAINLLFIEHVTFAIPNAYHQLLTYTFIAFILLFINRLKLQQAHTISIVLVLAAFIFYLASSAVAGNLMQGIIENKYAAVHSVTHWLSAAALSYLLYKLVVISRSKITASGNGFAWLINILLLIFFSIECKHLYLAVLANPTTLSVYQTQYLKAGLTIVWALFSFTIMWLGMKYKYKTLRIISLSIFTLALLKLFLLDIRNISEGGKIAAFIMLGVLLLVISFMYQRLKKIIIDNEDKTV